MKQFIQYLCMSIAMLLATSSIHAQSYLDEEIPTFRHQVKIGYPIEIGLGLNFPKTGVHISYNPTYKLMDFISAEGQISYNYTDFERNSSTFARDGGDSQSLNVLVGGRLYVLGESSPIRIYVNAMTGLVQFMASEFNADGELVEDNGYSIGLSTGVYIQYNNTWSAGASLETRNFLVLRAGYTF